MIELSPIELRVLGCLVEKERTTPDVYPLTLNGLLAACNQKSSREPVMNITAAELEKVLDTMRYEKHVVYQVSQAGSRVPKYRHNIEKIGVFSEPDLAVLCVLMLRGPQTAGEIKMHSQRLYNFATLQDVDGTLEELRASVAGPFIAKLSREPGKREQRYVHLLSGDAVPACHEPEVTGEGGETDAPVMPLAERVEQLTLQVSTLYEEFDRLRKELGLTPLSFSDTEKEIAQPVQEGDA